MENVFLAISHYQDMPDSEVERIRSELQMSWWKPTLKGFHPMFDQSVTALFDNPYRIRYSIISKDGNLPRARAFNLAIWREEYDTENRCEYFMILDDDISFPSESLDLLIKSNKPIIGGIYTFKSRDPKIAGKVCTRFWDKQKVYLDKPFSVRWLNGGFIMIKAAALLRMIDKYPDLIFDVPSDNSNINARLAWALWTPMVYQLNGERLYLGEDWSFCERARKIGYEIWADVRFPLIHWSGEFGYSVSWRDK